VHWCHHVVEEEEEGGLLQRGARKRSQVYTIAAILKGFHLPAGQSVHGQNTSMEARSSA
jgi:hypothetical protein